jgi:hypothetical protein
MLNSVILETAIGLAFVYLIFSLIASGIAEYLSAYLDRRGRHLRDILFNLFDNDDPRGRTFLKLFITHPMVQALNSTDWKPEFQSAEARLNQVKEQFNEGRAKWDKASQAAAAAKNATAEAAAADTAAKAATEAASKLKNARKAKVGVTEAEASALSAAIAAETAALAADNATTATNKVKQDLTQTLQAKSTASDVRQPPAGVSPPVPIASPQQPDPPAQTRPAPSVASDPADRAIAAASMATKSAKAARASALAADKTSRGLGKELIEFFSVPKYIPDRTFVNVLLNVLTDSKTVNELNTGTDRQNPLEPSAGALPATTFWARFSAALKVLRGIALRVPATSIASRKSIDDAVEALEQAIQTAAVDFSKAPAVIAALESGINNLRGAVASVPDDSLRLELQREIDLTLRPLEALGQDIVLLQGVAQSIVHMAESPIKTVLSAFITQAGDDLEAFKTSVTGWYNDVMDHASGWYKRNTQYILFLIAFALCTLNNVDTISLVRHLSTDPNLRDSIGQIAIEEDKQHSGSPEGAADSSDPIKLKATLEKTGLPLWWTRDELIGLWSAPVAKATKPGTARTAGAWETVWSKFVSSSPMLTKLLGLALSIMAVSMGAPFWFDVLNKLVNVRLVGRKPEATAPVPVAANPTAPSPPPGG